MSDGALLDTRPHVVQAQRTSSAMTSGTSARLVSRNNSSRRSITTSLGERGLPVFQAGHWLWQRPHSVQDTKSSSCFQVKWPILPAPKIASSSIVSRSIAGGLVEGTEA